MRQDFAAFGFAVEDADMPEPEAPFEIWSDCWISFTTFLRCETQWRIASGMSGFIWLGLDYTAVDVVLRRYKVDEAVFDDLRLMEAEALEVFGESVE